MLPKLDSHESPSGKLDPQNMRLSILMFTGCLVFTALAWHFYLQSSFQPGKDFVSLLILFAGFLFAISSGLFVFLLQTGKADLEKQVDETNLKLLRWERENKTEHATSVALYWLGQLMSAQRKLQEVLNTGMDLSKKVLDADEGSIMLLDKTQELYIAASSGIRQEVVQSTRIKMGERIAGRAAQLRKEYLLVGAVNQYEEFKSIHGDPKIGSSLVCPLICRNQILGVLNLNRFKNKVNFTEEDLRHAVVFASQLSQAIWNAKIDEFLISKEETLEQAYQKLKDL